MRNRKLIAAIGILSIVLMAWVGAAWALGSSGAPTVYFVSGTLTTTADANDNTVAVNINGGATVKAGSYITALTGGATAAGSAFLSGIIRAEITTSTQVTFTLDKGVAFANAYASTVACQVVEP